MAEQDVLVIKITETSSPGGNSLLLSELQFKNANNISIDNSQITVYFSMKDPQQ